MVSYFPLDTRTAVPSAAAVLARTFVGYDGNTAAAGAAAAGVFRTDGNINEATTYYSYGCVPVTAGGPIAAGALVEVGPNGQAVAHNTGIVAGRAYNASVNVGDVLAVEIFHN
ncbi:DUF2190 family protein [Burkholderia pseudomallei]|uniref:DUF2190 family protein n=1 Tax=Burkholderia pseudomallei TaxID=28450 RepID=UPI0009763597|nr:DUF2190 family protein [Burkholderia pseudomallei]OMS07804.1 hypothetical protein AQ736_03385 [Burkholderia pseudomallei]OMS96432.1 hypothetical protein AQ750_04665 [Burkholderia pseudomallei]OMV27161.1 hypothetical protein AQ787_14155 [Burkholderia pseudomallei]CAJ3486372.1 Uncharacterised protein [Burkholderia pseudomallei]CAJ4175763.1 Uncharacterised protein [Burkholderia pseudomallei]